MNAPLKVPDVFEALKLRNEDELSYPAIAKVMARYRGVDRSADGWRVAMSALGEPRKSPRGRPFERVP